jgi:dihydrolipoamide dehydrogenase
MDKREGTRMTAEYDVVIIGGGAAGANVAGRTSPGGLSTVIIESELVGGACTYWACMPSKALLRPGEALAAAKAVPALADAITGGIDATRALRGRNAFANAWNDYWQVKRVESVNADLIRGVARLDGPKRVVVELAEGGTQEVIARKALVVATGSHANVPAIDGIDEVGAYLDRDITTAQTVPESLVILGGGAVGLEMAEAWASLGTKEVTVVDHHTLDDLRHVEPFAMHIVAESLKAKGIRFRTECDVASTAMVDGQVVVTLDNGDRVTAERLVLAAGRRPNTAGLGLEALGLPEGEPIKVSDTLQAEGVDDGWLYAVGDVNGRALFTHQAKYQARQAGDHILGKGTTAWADHVAVPGVIFTDPQVGPVGMTEREAREKGVNVRGRIGVGCRRGDAAWAWIAWRGEVDRRRGSARAGEGDVRGAGSG